MGQKLMRTEEELQTILLGELRTHAECSDVMGVTISRAQGETWSARAVNRDGGSAAYQRMMEEVVAQLNVAYGLARERRREVAH
jgi:hypothetical protein